MERKIKMGEIMDAFDDYMKREHGKTRKQVNRTPPIKLKRSMEADILASFDLSDELVGYLCKMGFEQREIPALNLNLFEVRNG